MPGWTTSGGRSWQAPAYVNRTTLALFGLDVTTLRCVQMTEDTSRNEARLVYELEDQGPGEIRPRVGQWFDVEEACRKLGSRVRTPLVEACLLHSEARPPAGPPWGRRGWFRNASQWIRGQVSHMGMQLTGPIEQVRVWERSCVLRIPTSTGFVYFKATPPVSNHELELTSTLAQRFPNQIPRVLAVDSDRRWMLLRDCGRGTLEDCRSVHRWEQALQEFSRIQVRCSSDVNLWLDLGCAAYPLPAVVQGLDTLCEDLSMERCGLSVHDVRRLKHGAPKYAEMCNQIAEVNLPLSLEHGDFWPGNIVTDGRKCIYLDWAEATVTHPFFCIALFLEYARALLPGARGTYARLRRAYLLPWRNHASEEDLISAFRLAWKVGPLYRALVYHQVILPHVEAKWEVRPLLTFFLKELLARAV